MAYACEDIQALIDSASPEGGVVNVPRGTYRLSTRIRIDDAQDLVLNGNGSTFIFTERSDGGVYVTNSRRVGLRDFAIDFDPVPFTQGEVVDMGEGGEWYDVRIDVGYDTDVSVFQRNLAMKVFEGDAHRFKMDGRLVFPERLTSERPGVFRADFGRPIAEWSNLRVGDRVAVTSDRPSHAMYMDHSDECVVDGVTVLGSPGTGVLESGGGGHRYRYTIRPGPPPEGAVAPRLLSSCADGLWSQGTHKGAELDGCAMAFVGDSGVNIHGTYCEAVEVAGRRIGFRSVMGGVFLEEGDRLWVYSPAYERKAETRIVSRADGALTVEDASTIGVGDIIISPDRTGRGAAIRNCTFRDMECEAMLLRCSDTLIEGNVIERNTFTGICLGMEVGVYVEADFLHNVTVRGNTLRQIGFQRWSRAESADHLGAISVAVLVPFSASVEDNRKYTDLFAGLRPNTNIIIEDNTIEECATFGIFLSSTSGAVIRGNRLSHTNAYPPLDAGKIYGIEPRSAICIHDSDQVTLEDNVVSELGPFGDAAVVVDSSADAASIDATGVELEE
jgi:parallel beta-helix repeat protein